MSFIQLQQAKSRDNTRVLTYVNLAMSVRKPGDKYPRQQRIYLGNLMPDGKTVSVSKRFAGDSGQAVPLKELKRRAKDGEDVAGWLAKMARATLIAATDSTPESVPVAEPIDAPKAVEEVGQPHVLGAIAGDLGLTKCLQESFGTSEGKALLMLAEHQVAEGRPLYMAQGWLGDIALAKEVEEFDFSSVGLSKFMANIGQESAEREMFFKRWADACGKPSSLIFDTTSLSTYSGRLSLAEWGYNRDDEALPQVNFSLVSGRERDLPLFYRLVPGSIPDVVQLKHTATRLQDLGINEFTCSLDRGFYSASNIRHLLAEKIGFVLGASFSSRQAKDLIRKHRAALNSPKQSIPFAGRVMRHIKAQWQADLGEGKKETLAAHIYLDPERRASGVGSVERRIFEMESRLNQEVSKGRIASLVDAKAWIQGHGGLLASGVTVKRKADGSMAVERCPHAIALLTGNKGYTIVLTSKKEASGEEILTDYRARDGIEKMFDILKNETAQNRVRSGQDTIAAGRLFLAFLGLILYRALENRMRDADILRLHSVAEVMAEVRKIRAIRTATGRRMLLEMTKKQRDLLAALRISPPAEV